MAAPRNSGVVSAAAAQHVVTGPADDVVFAAQTVDDIVAHAAIEPVVVAFGRFQQGGLDIGMGPHPAVAELDPIHPADG